MKQGFSALLSSTLLLFAHVLFRSPIDHCCLFQRDIPDKLFHFCSFSSILGIEKRGHQVLLFDHLHSKSTSYSRSKLKQPSLKKSSKSKSVFNPISRFVRCLSHGVDHGYNKITSGIRNCTPMTVTIGLDQPQTQHMHRVIKKVYQSKTMHMKPLIHVLPTRNSHPFSPSICGGGDGTVLYLLRF
jgi:hypothetical protein